MGKENRNCLPIKQTQQGNAIPGFHYTFFEWIVPCYPFEEKRNEHFRVGPRSKAERRAEERRKNYDPVDREMRMLEPRPTFPFHVSCKRETQDLHIFRFSTFAPAQSFPLLFTRLMRLLVSASLDIRQEEFGSERNRKLSTFHLSHAASKQRLPARLTNSSLK